ncbi:hypothetical protein LZ30DRAFT_402987 [Colletotrichum cereale]|nr:hypothetical protein LZ30DRAFT_402987 [Colletotrichum cereale]
MTGWISSIVSLPGWNSVRCRRLSKRMRLVLVSSSESQSKEPHRSIPPLDVKDISIHWAFWATNMTSSMKMSTRHGNSFQSLRSWSPSPSTSFETKTMSWSAMASRDVSFGRCFALTKSRRVYSTQWGTDFQFLRSDSSCPKHVWGIWTEW